jgi:copper type II ascorbate-dependent monooxygenase-like protein
MKRSWVLFIPVLFGLWTAYLLAQARPRAPHPPLPRTVDSRPPLAAEPVTFSKQVVRVLQSNCQKCHHEGGIAPFSLTSFADAYSKRLQISIAVSDRVMPPWHAGAGCAQYQNDPSLSAQDIATLRGWVDSGAPEGDPRDLPPPLTFSDGWALGQPDMVLTMPEPMRPDFSRGDIYRCFVLPTGLEQDRYVTASEVSPGSPKMVHHVILFVDSTGVSEQLDAQDPGPGYTCFGGPGFTMVSALGGWAPGNAPSFLPEGIGIPLARGSRVVMQVHYSALSGVNEADRTSVGLHFSRVPVRKRYLIAPIINTDFVIPAGVADHEVTASIGFLPVGVHVYSITPHMHLLGRKMNVMATFLDGAQRCLVDVQDWDFHWQRSYEFAEPVALPAGTRINLTARYDNSADNPQNPNSPPREARWGEATTDEMCIAFLGLTLDAENLTSASGRSAAAKVPPFWDVEWPLPPRDPEAIVPAHWRHRH